jgi:hypothetical protein
MNGLLLLSLKTTSDSALHLKDHISEIGQCWSSMTDFDKKCLITTAHHEWMFNTSIASSVSDHSMAYNPLDSAHRISHFKRSNSSTSPDTDNVSSKKIKSLNKGLTNSNYDRNDAPDFSSLTSRQIIGIQKNNKKRDNNILKESQSTVAADFVGKSNLSNKSRRTESSSSFKGVVRIVRNERVRWRVKVLPTPRLKSGSRETRLSRVVVGEYLSEEEAARAYDQAVRTMHGPSATTNYHEDGSRNEHAKYMKLT